MSTDTSSTSAPSGDVTTADGSTAQIDALESVLRKTAALVDGVRDEQVHEPTPCPGYDVGELRLHMVQWVRVFASGLAGADRIEDPESFRTEDHAGEFRRAAEQAVQGARSLGLDRDVRVSAGAMPGSFVVGMMIGEYVAHGWDLAQGTGQQVAYTDDEAAIAQTGMAPMLVDDYRGEDKPFGLEVPAPDDASGLVKFLCFSGRPAAGGAAKA